VHQSDQQGAPAKSMRVSMCGARMGKRFAGMAVGVDMSHAVAMPVAVKMHAVAPQPPQHMRAETDQHDADGGFDRPRDRFRDRAAKQNRGAGKAEQRQRMAQAPGQAVPDDIANMAAARGDAGHRGDMIGFQRMLHAQDKPKSQNSEHVTPARLASLYTSLDASVGANFWPNSSRVENFSK
jgi:hypothetical protein